MARACRRFIAHVLVDEYQDINQVQESILRLVSCEDRLVDEPSVTPPRTNSLVSEGQLPLFGEAAASAPIPHSKAPQPNLFCVGDVKQSIYSFRLAEPRQFLARQERFRQGHGNGKLIDLQTNYRSRAPLLEALNGLFERLMTKEAADITYGESHKLRRRRNLPRRRQ